MDLERVQQMVTDYGPGAVGVGSTLDNTGVPIFFVIGMGVALASKTTAVLHAMLIAAIVGSIAGDLAVYAIGRYFLTKERILMGNIGKSFQPIIDAGENMMRRWGILTVVFGRFVPYVGKITPFLAGSYRMSWLKASLSVTVGSVLLLGFFFYFAQAAYEVVSGNASLVKYVSLAIGVGVLAALCWANHVMKKKGKQKSDSPWE